MVSALALGSPGIARRSRSRPSNTKPSRACQHVCIVLSALQDRRTTSELRVDAGSNFELLNTMLRQVRIVAHFLCRRFHSIAELLRARIAIEHCGQRVFELS